MARALAWHARGQGFESPYLHNNLCSHESLIMGYTVYILYSPSFDRYYISQTENLENRIFRHNNSGSKSTKKANDWRMVYSETYERRSTAVVRELEIKKQKSRKYIKELISRFG